MTASVAVLYSGGRDSTLAALLLDPFYDVTLCPCSFGVASEAITDRVRPGADALGRPLEPVELDRGVARDSVDRMVTDGYPRTGIQQVHEHALETVAERFGDEVSAVADGTRRDDRVPTVDRATAQSIEDRLGVDSLHPLAGYGRSAVDALADRELVVETGPSETLRTGDYETELRSLLADRHGPGAVDTVFPDHVQSRVVDRRA